MILEELLEQNRDDILQRWFELILSSYPTDGSRFFRNEKDRFRNPVGHTIRKEIEVIFRNLQRGGADEIPFTSLDDIVKIRLVQDFSPSQAVAWVFLLKQAVRDSLLDHLTRGALFEQLLDFESRVDRLALAAFESYMANREKIYEIRAREISRRSENLQKRLERTYGKRSREENGGKRFPHMPDRGDSTS